MNICQKLIIIQVNFYYIYYLILSIIQVICYICSTCYVYFSNDNTCTFGPITQ